MQIRHLLIICAGIYLKIQVVQFPIYICYNYYESVSERNEMAMNYSLIHYHKYRPYVNRLPWFLNVHKKSRRLETIKGKGICFYIVQ